MNDLLGSWCAALAGTVGGIKGALYTAGSRIFNLGGYLTDASANVLTDSAGNRITYYS
jgi:hypothetical protein